MRLISLNAWGGVMHGPLMDWLAASDPDILCLQEMIRTPGAGQDWLEYRDGDHVLPQRANLFAEVAAILPGHDAVFCPAGQGDLWDGARAVPSLWGLASFVRRSLPVVGQAQGFIHGDFAPAGFGQHPRPRSAHGVRVFDPAAGCCVSVVQAHGLRDPVQGKADTPERAVQTDRLLALADGLARPGEGLVLCGDFNVRPGSAMLQRCADRGWRELVTETGALGTRTSLYAKPDRFADYMVVNPAVRVRDFAVVRAPEVSDHCALSLSFGVQGAAA